MTLKLGYVVALFILSSCSSFKEKIGLAQYSPNEFETMQNDPLNIPEHLSVHNPNDGVYQSKKRLGETIKSLLTPANSTKKRASSRPLNTEEGEQALMKKMGLSTSPVSQNVRTQLYKDQQEKETSLHDKIQRTLVFWRKPEKGKVIDPSEEKKKLSQESVAQ